MKSSGRDDAIDALRGIAALLVVFQHCLELVAHSVGDGLKIAITDLTHSYVNWGKVGVVAFFAISGFVVPFSLKGRNFLRPFLVKRFFRLYPPYWLSLAVAVMLMPLITAERFSSVQIAANVTMVQDLFRQPDVIPVYWTLFIELIFYGLCVLAFSRGVLSKVAYLTVASLGFLGAAALLAAYRWGHPASGAPIAIPLGLAVMHTGTLTRVAREAKDWVHTVALTLVLVVGLLAVFPICRLAYFHEGDHEPWMAVATSYVVGMAFFGAAAFWGWFATRITIWLGGISYALYLFHPIVMHFALYAARNKTGADYAWTAILLTVGGSLVVAAAVFYLLEKRSNALGHRLGSTVPRLAVQPSPAE